MLSKPSRFFEIGADSNTSFANNTFGLKDILTKDVKIDFQKITDDMPDSGFKLGFYSKEKAFVNMNISSRFRFSFFTDIESSGMFNISKDFFDILGSGIDVGETKKIDITTYADVFLDLGFSFQTLVGGYGIKITPTYYVPLLYVPTTTATAKMSMNSDGEIKANASAQMDVYTAVNMENYIEDDADKDKDINVEEILSNGGFDISLEIERNWLHGLNAGLYTRLPILPGKLNYKMSTLVYADFYEENLMTFVTDSDREKPKPKSGHVKPSTYNPDNHDDEEDGFEYSEDSYKAYRPFKFGLNATYMPWGQWLKIQPSLGFAVRNPYTSDAIFYMEYALDFRLSMLARIFNVNFGTAYQNKIFQHRFGLAINLRALEIISQVSMCGTSFISTFHTTGYGALVGVRIGF
ncbi:MAG: hypothetical protein IJ727_04150 [Treponema sp.]|nr:hypothetical protein [Treponema sp.]